MKDNYIHLLSNKQVFWILLSVIVAVIPHFPRLPIWFGLLLVTSVAMRWSIAVDKIRPMPNLIIALITVFIFIAIIYLQGFSLNREISVTLLTTMTVLKLLETWKKRDAWMVVTLCYFVILTRFFYSQDMLLVFYLLGSVIVITHTLFVLQHNNHQKYFNKSELKSTIGLLAAGIPLAVLFFLFFPRLGSPIWGSPDLFGQGKTGMSEEMSPGSISQLFNDDSTAFRVIFDDNIPSPSFLYWRGPVLWDFDGKTWTRNKKNYLASKHASFADSGIVINYEVELEPTGQNFLFALDYPLYYPDKTRLLTDSQLISDNKVNQLRHYKTTSVLKNYNSYELLSRKKIHQLTTLPKGFNPKTLKLILDWKNSSQDDEELIQKVLNWFRNDQFFYSYTPPILHGNTIDQFLFETKSGFCEHYASAFTVMMRAAGIPSRVVTGYQGGIKNEDYFLVKQSDAHAWSEVWIKNKGWLRVDPTAAVSPERVEKGSQALMNQMARNWHDTGWYRKLGERYDGVRHKWNQWIRNYNATKQKALFEVIGFDSQNGKSIAIVLGIIMIITTFFVLLYLYITRPKRLLNHYDKIYNKFLSVFVKQGLKKPDDQGVVAFAEIVSTQFPKIQTLIEEFTQLYIKLRFSKLTKKHKVLEMRLLNLIKDINLKI